MTFRLFLRLFLVGCLLWGCAPRFLPPDNDMPDDDMPDNVMLAPRLTESSFITFDSTALPLRVWLPDRPPVAVMVALHGYNDYGNFIKDAAGWFTARGIGIYAYDQRGFGAAPRRGKWAGHEVMADDLRTFISLVRKRHPEVSLHLLGDSMGGAVVMVAERPEDPLQADGIILIAPAVWARSTMPFYQRWVLWLGARLLPWLRVSPEGLDITPSDNREMLKALGRDPLILHESRIDALHGLANLMDAAYEAAGRFDRKVLFLYGARDEIIPPRPMADVFVKRVQGRFAQPQRLLVYENGYHMLLRDLQAEVVWNDILHWLTAPAGDFPSVRDKAAQEITRETDVQRFLHP